MKDKNYIVIQGWMINNLKLKGNDLIIYAIIYGFSQDGLTKFTGSLNYLEKASGVSRNTVKNSIKKLIDLKLIKKEEEYVNNIKFCKYSHIEPVGQNLTGGAKIDEGRAKIDSLGKAKIAPNNTIYNNTNNNIEGENKFSDASQIDLLDSINEIEEEKEKKVAPKKRKIFIKPTIEETEDYIYNSTNDLEFSKLEAKKFFNYYESKGWMVGKSKMQKWKAAANGWLTRSKEFTRTVKQENRQQPRTAAEELKQKLGLQ